MELKAMRAALATSERVVGKNPYGIERRPRVLIGADIAVLREESIWN